MMPKDPRKAPAPQKGPATGPMQQVRTTLRQGAVAEQLPAQMLSRYKRLSAVDLFRQFRKEQLLTKGMMATSFGSSGWGGGAYFSVDAGSFILPGVFTLKLEIGAQATETDTVVLALHRAMPLALYAMTAPGPPLWSSNRPVGLLALVGKSYSGQVGVQAEVGLQVELPTGSTGSETADAAAAQLVSLSQIPLAIGVSATAGAAYTYDRLYVQDPFARWYPDSQDAGLQRDFTNILLPGKTATKRELIQWINSFSDKVFALNSNALQLLQQDPQQLHEAFCAKQNALHHKQQGGLTGYLARAHALAATTKGRFPQVTTIYDTLARKAGELEAQTYTTDGLIALIDNLKVLIPTAEQLHAYYVIPATPKQPIEFYHGDPDNLPLMQRAMEGMRMQLDTFRARLVALKAAESAPPPVAAPRDSTQRGGIYAGQPYNRFNTFLKIVSHTAEGTAGVTASALAAYARAGISGKYKRAAYRYQTVAPASWGASKSLIYTQDTSITYRMASTALEGGATFYNRKFEKDLLHCALTYQSACMYWLYEEVAPAQGTGGRVRPRVGSGLSYGVSVRVDELARCRAEILKLNLPNQWPMPGLGPNVPSRSLIYTLAGYLRVSFNYLIWFLSNLGPTALEGLPVPAVLLESSFVVPLLDANLQVELKGKQYTDPSDRQSKTQNVYRLGGIRSQPFVSATAAQLDNLPNAFANCQNHLQAIRVRGRMADYRESSVTFKLGIPIGGPDALGTGITLTKIANAGQEGIIEIVEQQYQAETDDRRVPPVALFHQ